jgi:hypothetical protein
MWTSVSPCEEDAAIDYALDRAMAFYSEGVGGGRGEQWCALVAGAYTRSPFSST